MNPTKHRFLFVAHWDWVLFNFRLPVARALAAQGHDVVMVCPHGVHTSALQGAGFRCVEWKMGRRSLNPVRELAAVARLIRIYRREKPAVVQHFTIKPNLYGAVAGRVAKVPVIVNAYTGLGFLFQNGLEAAAIRGTIRPLLRLVSRPPNVWTVTQNNADYELLTGGRIAARSRTVMIPGSGVDTRRFHPPVEGPPDPPTVIMASRLIREKGVREYVEAATTVARSEPAARFLLAGEPDEGNPSSVSLQELSHWNSAGIVELLGQRSDMDAVLRDCAVAVLPTYYREGLPRFLLEAGATGLPLVASDIAGCRSIVRDGENGYLIPVKDANALADKLLLLLRNPDLRARLGKHGRRLALEEFSEPKTVDAYLTFYARALGAKSRRSVTRGDDDFPNA